MDAVLDNKNIFGEEISPQEMEIINYINERELFYESKAREKILDEVKEKFGDIGNEVLKQLSEDVHIDPKDFECEDCGKASKELTSSALEKIKLVEVFLDEEFSDIIDDVLSIGMNCEKIPDSRIQNAILKHTKYKIDEIPPEVMSKVKTKILFTGIIEGWLEDEFFTD